MVGREYVTKKKRFFSSTVVVMLVASSMISINIQVPSATAIKTHTIGNVDIEMITAFGRILGSLDWKFTHQAVEDPATGGLGFIGLVLDHDGYDHTPGAENIAADTQAAYPHYNFEKLLKENPEYIIIPEGLVEKKEIEEDSRWQSLDAVKEGRVLFINADILSRPGPRVVEAIEEIAGFIHEKKTQ